MNKINIGQKIWAKRYLLLFLLLWTFGAIASALLNLHGVYKDSLGDARTEARIISEQNLAYRRWNSLLGGIYARVSDFNTPNPYVVAENKDLVTTDGISLTMISPFQMTKQVYDLLRDQGGDLPTINRTVSLKPLNPENSPDEWETNALLAVTEGKNEVSELTEISGYPYMRLLVPYITEQKCLRCHQHQKYQVGDLRGGISISVPMKPYYDAALASQGYIVITHFLLWVVGVITIFVFFIGLKKYRRDLAESSNKFRIVSEFAHNLEYWINKDQQIVFISPSCERITGYSIKDFEKNPALLGEMTHPEDKELYEKNFADMKKTIHEDFQYRIVTKSGQTRWISHTCNPIHLVENYLGQRGSIKDITNQKALEDQLIQAQKVECLGHFAGGIAHDFNNVLSSITTFAHLLDEELQDRRSDLVKYVNYITIAAKLGRNLTSNLLAFGRPQIIRLRVTNINGIIRNISDIIKSLLTEEIEYTIELTPREKPIFADYHQIEQIIINLCTNARDSMPSGGQLIIRSEFLLLHEGIRKAHVDIPAGGYMILSVSDTGRGISPEDLPNIFEPFYSTKEKKKGTGLGLVIISNIVKQHNAFIDVDSKPGSGTTFQIYFPVTEKVSSEEEPLQTFEEQPSFSRKYYEYHEENDETGNAILLVEDEELVRESLYAILELRGYSIFLAKNGAEAIEEYRKHQKEIGLVVLDVMLPKKNGLETYKAIKEINNSVKAVFISGYTKDADITREIIREGLDLLEKPLNIEKFMDKVGKLLPE